MDSKTLINFTEQHFTIKEWGETIRFHPKTKPCDRCGEMVEGQCITFSKKFYEYRTPFWEMKCNSCDMKTTAKSLSKLDK